MINLCIYGFPQLYEILMINCTKYYFQLRVKNKLHKSDALVNGTMHLWNFAIQEYA